MTDPPDAPATTGAVAAIPPAPVAPTPAAPSPAPPAREGAVREHGIIRRDALRAQRWDVDGMAKVAGEVDVGALGFHGSLSVGGRLAAGSVAVDGALEVAGPVEIEGTLEVHGSSRFDEGLIAGALTVTGPIRCAGAVRVAGVARITGEGNLAKGGTFAALLGRGGLSAGGPIAAERVAYEITRDSHVEAIDAAQIAITRPSAPPFKIPGLMPERPTLTVLRMEAKEVRLEGVSVEVLKADTIHLGPDCHVARAIGTVVDVDRSSRVGPESRSPPPHGIWR